MRDECILAGSPSQASPCTVGPFTENAVVCQTVSDKKLRQGGARQRCLRCVRNSTNQTPQSLETKEFSAVPSLLALLATTVRTGRWPV
jgi:hypothetical protein